MGADHDHRNPVLLHDLFQHVQPAHARHFQIEGDHLRAQVFDLLQPKVPIDRGAHHPNRVIGLENLRNDFPHQRRVIDDEHPNWFCAHGPTSDNAREFLWVCKRRSPEGARSDCGAVKRSTTAGKFMINTTRPSPRMEAPLTRSVAMVWSSKALMTSSSSPSSASTMSPNLRPLRRMTRTKILSRFESSSPSGFWPRRSSGKTCPRSCSTSQRST